MAHAQFRINLLDIRQTYSRSMAPPSAYVSFCFCVSGIFIEGGGHSLWNVKDCARSQGTLNEESVSLPNQMCAAIISSASVV